MAGQQLDEWVAEQLTYFKPGDMDAGIEIMRRNMQRLAEVERQQPAA